MNFSKKNHEIVQQNDANVKKAQKHDANLQKNSTLYFQIGLILTLLVVYSLFEMKFETKPIEIAAIEPLEEDYMFNKQIKVFDKTSQKIEQKKKKPIIFKDPIIKEDDDLAKETKDVITEPIVTSKPPIKPSEVPPVIIIDEIPPRNVWAVEQVPIYPGCEGLNTNTQRRDCMQKKLAKLIDRKFDKELASELGLIGKQRIFVRFKIDKFGHVTDIKTRAPHKKLEKEAIRVINKVPQMIPGKQKNNAVDVIYQLPILFMVEY